MMLISHKYPDAYIRYLAEFHGTRDYFECHEILEEYWKEHPGDEQAQLWHGLIQIAVGQYHLRRGNREGARKMLRSAWQRLSPPLLEQAGLDGGLLRRQLDEAASLLERGEEFLLLLDAADPGPRAGGCLQGALRRGRAGLVRRYRGGRRAGSPPSDARPQRGRTSAGAVAPTQERSGARRRLTASMRNQKAYPNRAAARYRISLCWFEGYSAAGSAFLKNSYPSVTRSSLPV